MANDKSWKELCDSPCQTDPRDFFSGWCGILSGHLIVIRAMLEQAIDRVRWLAKLERDRERFAKMVGTSHIRFNKITEPMRS